MMYADSEERKWNTMRYSKNRHLDEADAGSYFLYNKESYLCNIKILRRDCTAAAKQEAASEEAWNFLLILLRIRYSAA